MTASSSHDLQSAEASFAVASLVSVGKAFFDRGWAVGTSGNFSILLSRDPFQLLITASGRDKGCLTPGDFVLVDRHGDPVSAGTARPSAETMLHVTLAAAPGVGAVLHTHSIWATLASDLFYNGANDENKITIGGYEMLKGLAGLTSHNDTLVLEIFDNTQDIPALARVVSSRLNQNDSPLEHGFLIRRHGLYTWGSDIAAARRHVEVIEFLLELTVRRSGGSDGCIAHP